MGFSKVLLNVTLFKSLSFMSDSLGAHEFVFCPGLCGPLSLWWSLYQNPGPHIYWVYSTLSCTPALLPWATPFLLGLKQYLLKVLFLKETSSYLTLSFPGNARSGSENLVTASV